MEERRKGNSVPQSRRASHVSRKSMTETMMQSKKKVCSYKCAFDRKYKCWIGPVPKDSQTSRWSKAKGAVLFLGLKSQQTRRVIDVESLVKATLRKRTLLAESSADDEMNEGHEENENFIVSTLSEKPIIRKPFLSSRDHKNQSAWVPPQPLKQAKERSQTFAFERPRPADKDKLSSAVSSHQAVFLKKILQEKEAEIQVLQRQLMKANTENVRLIKELDGYRGKNYDETYSENLTLKDNLNRVTRENVMLRGRIRQDGNHILNKIQNRVKTAPTIRERK